MEEDEEYEMLEVQEEEDNGQPNQSGESASEAESPTKLHVSNTSDKEDTTLTKLTARQQATPTNNAQSGDQKTHSTKLLNSLATNSPKCNVNTSSPQTSSATAAALQKKGITMKKTTGNLQTRSSANHNLKTSK
ncbi:hypothetical protein EVAR_101491_1 [Eumeta japonica]|uniref:Uncharacterized protein n=1 Tax=Eumeta variegata TaxID=151549 RepID=A0A4C1T7D8_EUMVA|nr:hypothetical protein EVAR_101491_1 [Eumeta japonica]